MQGPFYLEKPAIAALPSVDGGMLWKKFCPSLDKDKKYSMAFYVATRDEFLKRYWAATPQDRMFCEVLPDGVPIKIYMDVEFYRAAAPGLDMDECVGLIQRCVADLLGMPTLVPFQLDASNDEKASRHLTWPVALKDKKAVESLVKHVVHVLREQGAPATGKNSACGIDLVVYARNQGMRICYSHKLKEFTRKLLPFPDKTMNAQTAMRQSLIAHFVEDVPLLEWTRPRVEASKKARAVTTSMATAAAPKRVKTSATATPVDDALLTVVKERLTLCYPGSFIDGEKMFDPNTLCVALRPGVVCPVAKRIHKSNCTWMNINVKTRIGTWACSDADCTVGKRMATWGCVQF